MRVKIMRFLRWLLGLDDPHCGGCAINCHLAHPNCATGKERAKDFYKKHPERKPEEEHKE